MRVAVPLQAWSGPEGSRKLRFLDFTITAQDCGKVVSLTHRPPLPQEMLLVLISDVREDNNKYTGRLKKMDSVEQ